MKFILLLSFFFIWTVSDTKTDKHDELHIVKTLGNGVLYFPAGPVPMVSYGSLAVLEDKKLLVYDSAGNQPFYVIDVEQEEMEPVGHWGNGPGEFLEEAPKIISITEESVYIYDLFNFFLHRFSLDLSYQDSLPVEVPSLIFASVLVLDEETLLFSNGGVNRPGTTEEHFFKKYSFDGRQIHQDYQSLLPFSSVEELYPIQQNISLKEGPLTFYDDTIYLANLFGSIILGIDTSGNQVFHTNLPEQADIPPAEPRFINGVLVGEPEITTFRNLDLAADEQYLYALYSGVTSSYENISDFMTGGTSGDEDIRIGEAKNLRVYNRDDGTYLGEFELPEWTAAITADESYLYTVVWSETPHIMVLEKPSF